MADVWDGGTATTGIIKYEFNTDKSAIRFSRTDAAAFPASIAQILINDMIQFLKTAAEGLEKLAVELDKIDTSFASTCRNRAALYRTAGAIT